MCIQPALQRVDNIRKWPNIEEEALRVALPNLSLVKVDLRGEIAEPSVHVCLGVVVLVMLGQFADEFAVVRTQEGDVAVLTIAVLDESVARVACNDTRRQGEEARDKTIHAG